MSESAKLLGPVDLRRSPRLTFALPVKIRGRDATGNDFTERTRTIDVNESGGKLQTRYLLRPRDPIYIENPMLKVATMATVAWVGRKKDPSEPWEIGIALDKPQNLWGIDFPVGSVARRASRSLSMAAPAATEPAGAQPGAIPEEASAPPVGRHATRHPRPSGAALRRSTRLTFSVAITITGNDADGKAFTEQTTTISINKHGGKIASWQHLKLGSSVQVQNDRVKKTVKATVVWVGERKKPSEPWEVGLELDEPQNIWGIDFPPDDWNPAAPLREKKAEASATPVLAQPQAAALDPSLPPPEKLQAPAAPLEMSSQTILGVTPPVLAPAPVPSAPETKPPARLAAPVQPTDVQAAAAHLSEQMKLLAEAHSRLFQKEFADLAAGIREKLQGEISAMVESAVQDATARARQQMQQDLEQFACQLTDMERHVTEASVAGLRKRVAAMLASLDQKP